MSAPPPLAQFLDDAIYGRSPTRDTTHLSQLQGARLGELHFFTSMQDAVGALDSWVPIYFLPLGINENFLIGAHLRPSEIERRRLPIMTAHDEMTFVEIARSIEHLAVRGVMSDEEFAARSGTRVPSSFDSAVARIHEVFGADAYVPGSEDFTTTTADTAAARRFGVTPFTSELGCALASDLNEKLSHLAAGLEYDPHNMGLRAREMLLHRDAGDIGAALAALERSLECLHYTIYNIDLDDYLEQAQDLAASPSASLSERAARDLTVVTEEDRVAWAEESARSGDHEHAIKLLLDVGHARSDYDSLVPHLRDSYVALGWDWAVALCDLR